MGQSAEKWLDWHSFLRIVVEMKGSQFTRLCDRTSLGGFWLPSCGNSSNRAIYIKQLRTFLKNYHDLVVGQSKSGNLNITGESVLKSAWRKVRLNRRKL